MQKTLGRIARALPLHAETMFYNMADQLSNGEYQGGHWRDRTPVGGVTFANLDVKQRFTMTNNYTQSMTEVSAETFSIICNLYYWSALSFKLQGHPPLQDFCAKRYHALRGWVFDSDSPHVDHLIIYQITD